MESTPAHSHISPAAHRALWALIDEHESRLITCAVYGTIHGQQSAQYAEARTLTSASRAALRDAIDALTWPAAYQTRVDELDGLLG